MRLKTINAFFIEVKNLATDMKSTVDDATSVQKQTSSIRVEIEVIKSKIGLIESEVDLIETLQKMSPDQLDFFYTAAKKERPTVVKSLSELKQQKSELEQQLTIKLRFLQEQTEIAESEIK